MVILTQPNTRPHVATHSKHILAFSGMCPVSKNPQEGSTITIEYRAASVFLEVYSLRKYIDSYKGGKDDIRDMEGMIQQIAIDCAFVLGVKVLVTARIVLQGNDELILTIEQENAS